MGCTFSKEYVLIGRRRRLVRGVDRSDLVLGLPQDFVRSVLLDWLLAKDIVRLDSSACSEKSRTLLLPSLVGLNLRFEVQGMLAGPNMFCWLLSRKVRTDALDLTSGRHNTAHKQQYLLENGKHLRFLCVGAEQSIHQVLEHCPNLIHIENVRIKPANSRAEDILAIQQYCSKVVSVQLINKDWLCNVSDIEHWRNLRQVDFSHFNSVIVALRIIVDNNPNLETIVLKRAGMASARIASQIIARGCPKLEYLYLGDVTYTLADADLELLATGCPNLRTFHFYGSMHYYGAGGTACWTVSGVRCLLQKCAKLSSLRFGKAPPIWDSLFVGCELSTLPGLSSLTSLSFLYCDGLTTDRLTQLLAACPALTELRIQYCPSVKGCVLGAVVEHCQCIRSVHLMGAVSLAEADITNLWLLIPRLRELCVDKTIVAADPKIAVALQSGRGVGCRIMVQ